MSDQRPMPEASYQVERLREAARRLDCNRTVGFVSLSMPVAAPWSEEPSRRADLPAVLCTPIRYVLLAAAEQIERAGGTLGQPVNHALQIAGVLLSEDLGHNR